LVSSAGFEVFVGFAAASVEVEVASLVEVEVSDYQARSVKAPWRSPSWYTHVGACRFRRLGRGWFSWCLGGGRRSLGRGLGLALRR
jgi:hypothetical protein